MIKWIALAAVVLGVTLLIAASRRSVAASFDDGSLIAVVSVFIVGAASLALGVVAFAVAVFQDL